jgi:hypothetical protein
MVSDFDGFLEDGEELIDLCGHAEETAYGEEYMSGKERKVLALAKIPRASSKQTAELISWEMLQVRRETSSSRAVMLRSIDCSFPSSPRRYSPSSWQQRFSEVKTATAFLAAFATSLQ